MSTIAMTIPKEQQNQVEALLHHDTILFQKFTAINEEFKGSLKLPNNVTTFRFTVLTFDSNGSYGINQISLSSHKPLVAYISTPEYIYMNESLAANLRILNNYDEKTGLTILSKE